MGSTQVSKCKMQNSKIGWGEADMTSIKSVKALTFDLFGMILDLAGSLTPFIGRFLKTKGSAVDPGRFWEQWRYRQRIEQYQDNIMMLGPR